MSELAATATSDATGPQADAGRPTGPRVAVGVTIRGTGVSLANERVSNADLASV